MTAYSEVEGDWLEGRRTGVPASLVASIIGLNPWERSSPEEVLGMHLAGLPVRHNPYMEAGKRLEPVILEWWNDITGKKAKSFQKLLRSERYPFLLCTPDAYEENDDMHVEIKCTSSRWASGEIPAHVLVQVQTQLIVLDKPSGYVVQWNWGDNPETHVVDADSRIQRMIIDTCRKVWEEALDQST